MSTAGRLASLINQESIKSAVALVLAPPITAQHNKLVVQINRLMKPTQEKAA